MDYAIVQYGVRNAIVSANSMEGESAETVFPLAKRNSLFWSAPKGTAYKSVWASAVDCAPCEVTGYLQ